MNSHSFVFLNPRKMSTQVDVPDSEIIATKWGYHDGQVNASKNYEQWKEIT